MPAGARLTYSVIALALALGPASGCRGRDDDAAPSTASPLEAAIARQLGRLANASISITCSMSPPRCVAATLDGATLPIALASEGGAWTWRVDGLFVRAQALETIVSGALTDLEVPQTVRCGPRVQRLAPDDRVTCTLGRGGRAFVVVHADGSTVLELALDAAAGAARSEVVTEANDRALEQRSGQLADDADADDNEAQ